MTEKKWYVMSDNPNASTMAQRFASKKIYLDVPFDEREDAKSEGFRWDMASKRWYIFENHPNAEEMCERY